MRVPRTLNPLDNDKMALLVEVLAHLHGTFWGRLPETPSGEGQFGWLWPPSADPSVPLTPHLMRLSARRLADRTPIPVDAGRFIWENFQAATAVVDEGPHTVLHGDSHPGTPSSATVERACWTGRSSAAATLPATSRTRWSSA